MTPTEIAITVTALASAFVSALLVLVAWGSGIKNREESKDE